jgi:hypothetical protein
VVQIGNAVNTFALERTLGARYAAWRGAVNIIFPLRRGPQGPYFPTTKLLPDAIADLYAEGGQPDAHVLALVAHRTNLPNSRRHIDIPMVQESQRRRELSALRDKAALSTEAADYIALLEQDNTLLRDRLGGLESELESAQFRAEELDDQLREQRFKSEGLRTALASGGTKPLQLPGMTDEIRRAIRAMLDRDACPKDILVALSAIFPERLVVLESALKSAEKSASFTYKDKLIGLMWKFAGQYWTELAEGRGDAQARSVLGEAFAAKESETVEANKGAREKRSFVYKGEQVEMMRHLKIGVKDSVVETIRVHFHWDAPERKLVVGYCGPHLDFK